MPAISKKSHTISACWLTGISKSRIQIHSNDEFEDIAADLNQAKDKLEEAVERGDFAENSKDKLVLNLAHDLRTPLTSVLGYLDLVLKDGELTAEQVKHYTTIAYTKSQRLEKLIDELFEITRMNYGMLTVEQRPLDLSELLVQLNEELYPLLENNGLTARIEITPQLKITGDGELLARVFENLLTNAVRYGKDGRYVDILCHPEDEQVVVQVINYGDRIPEEDLPFSVRYVLYGRPGANPSGRQYRAGIVHCQKNIVEQHQGDDLRTE
ncbi:sensor histidine kinase [Paenibacillus rhizoplanae]